MTKNSVQGATKDLEMQECTATLGLVGAVGPKQRDPQRFQRTLYQTSNG